MTTNIDPNAKITVKLLKKTDKDNNPYYIGKLQFNGVLNFNEGGNLFMIFTADDGAEELQIGPIDSNKSKKFWEGSSINQNGERISIPLRQFKDRDDNPIFIGEAEGDVSISMKNGIFFTIFTSVKGKEQIQITPLREKRTQSSTQLKTVEVAYKQRKVS